MTDTARARAMPSIGYEHPRASREGAPSLCGRPDAPVTAPLPTRCPSGRYEPSRGVSFCRVPDAGGDPFNRSPKCAPRLLFLPESGGFSPHEARSVTGPGERFQNRGLRPLGHSSEYPNSYVPCPFCRLPSPVNAARLPGCCQAAVPRNGLPLGPPRPPPSTLPAFPRSPVFSDLYASSARFGWHAC